MLEALKSEAGHVGEFVTNVKHDEISSWGGVWMATRAAQAAIQGKKVSELHFTFWLVKARFWAT